MSLKHQGRPCTLKVSPAGEAQSLEGAYALLPAQGTGVLVFADRIERFQPGLASGLLLEAEVVDGHTTTLLRMMGSTWKAWHWQERPGHSHRCVESSYLSSEAGASGAGSVMHYRSYWGLVADDGIEVWQPMGSRFAGFGGQ